MATKLKLKAGTVRKGRAARDGIIPEAKWDPSKAIVRTNGWPKQSFHVSHLREEDFKGGAFRSYVLSRDLGFAKATNGLVEAHVNRRARPFDAKEVSKVHFHDTLFQMVYVLKGWVRSEFEGMVETYLTNLQGTFKKGKLPPAPKKKAAAKKK